MLALSQAAGGRTVIFVQASTLALRLEPFLGDRNVLQQFLAVACADGSTSDRNATGSIWLPPPTEATYLAFQC
jgi:hypothetical protein